MSTKRQTIVEFLRELADDFRDIGRDQTSGMAGREYIDVGELFAGSEYMIARRLRHAAKKLEQVIR